MSNTNYKSENVINDAYNTLIGGRSSQIASIKTPNKTANGIADSASSSYETTPAQRHCATAASSPFVNGDLIDLCDQFTEHDQLNENVNHPVEAINSQLLADLSGESLHCYRLNPPKTASQRYYTNSNGQRDSAAMLNSVMMTRSNEAIDQSGGESNLTASSSPASQPPTKSTNEQHQTQAIREFKRIGTYCTLRPEQRRKHLLKVLPTLRNSMLLQSLFGSQATPKHCTKALNTNNRESTTTDELKQPLTTADDSHDIDTLLIDLDDFILDSNITRMQRHSHNEMNSNVSRGHSDDLATGFMKIVDPDKVEDCLLELDAYLEEIDRDYVLACAANAPNTILSIRPSTSTTVDNRINNGTPITVSANECIKPKNLLQNQRVRPPAMDTNRIVCEYGDRGLVDNDCIINSAATTSTVVESATNLRKQISYSDIQMNECGRVTTMIVNHTAAATSNDNSNNETNGSPTVDNQRKSNDIANNQPLKCLKRGHKLRNTVTGSGYNQNRAIATYNTPFQCGKWQVEKETLRFRFLVVLLRLLCSLYALFIFVVCFKAFTCRVWFFFF